MQSLQRGRAERQAVRSESCSAPNFSSLPPPFPPSPSQTTVIGLIVGSLFYQLGATPGTLRSFFGAAFLIVMFTSMGGVTQMQPAVATKGVW